MARLKNSDVAERTPPPTVPGAFKGECIYVIAPHVNPTTLYHLDRYFSSWGAPILASSQGQFAAGASQAAPKENLGGGNNKRSESTMVNNGSKDLEDTVIDGSDAAGTPTHPQAPVVPTPPTDPPAALAAAQTPPSVAPGQDVSTKQKEVKDSIYWKNLSMII